MSILFGILVLWAMFGRLDIIASAEGRLVPQTYVKIVQPADAGIVQEILVREGEAVQAGQVLLRLDRQVAEADQRTLNTEAALRALQLQRIGAELGNAPFQPRNDIPSDLAASVTAQYHDHRKAYEDAINQATERLKKAKRDHEAGVETLEKLKEAEPILKEQAMAYTEMGKDGYVPQVMMREKQREHLEKARELNAQQATVASLAAAAAEATKQLDQVTSKYRSDLQNERIDAEGQYRKLQQELVKQAHKVDLLELKAPQAGVVKDLATHTVGTVVSTGTVLLSLVPESEPLIAEVRVKNDDVGFVYPGQITKLKLVPYPFEKYGLMEGTVVHVGPDADEADPHASGSKDGNKSTPQTPAYKALISLKNQRLDTQGKSFKLVPGMQVIAEIHQGRRSVFEYLLSPVQKTLHDSGRER
ncbi:MAG: HlyD family type I secretion periplasmic adaptor subunit [Oryzomicrobium sp.]|nr:HlyD family type I secretion periplasmic adaptor subunit [Oryzomicrobium sp.]